MRDLLGVAAVPRPCRPASTSESAPTPACWPSNARIDPFRTSSAGSGRIARRETDLTGRDRLEMAGRRGRIRPPLVALRRLGGCSEARTLAHRENSPGVQAFQARRGRPPVRPLRRPGISPAQRPRRATSNWTVIPRLSSASASRRSGRRRTQAAEPRSHPQESTMRPHHVKTPIPRPQPPSGQRDKQPTRAPDAGAIEALLRNPQLHPNPQQREATRTTAAAPVAAPPRRAAAPPPARSAHGRPRR